MSIPDRRSVLFLRMAEILGGHAAFAESHEERKAMLTAWVEIAPEVLAEMQRIRDEQGDTLTEFVEAGE